MAIYVTKSEEETFSVAEQFAKTLCAGDVVLLKGEMGAGKTAFAKGVAKGLRISCEVTSPTYAYINDYEGRLFHFDCYRIESEGQAIALGFLDYFEMGGICLIEWSERIAGLLPPIVKTVTIKKGEGSVREISV